MGNFFSFNTIFQDWKEYVSGNNGTNPLEHWANEQGYHVPTDFFRYGPKSVFTYPQEDWSNFKHQLIPDMRSDREAMINSAINSRKIVYGRTRVGGQLAYAESGGTDNEFLYLLVIFAAHEIDSYQQIWFDDKVAATVSDGVVTISETYTGKCEIELFDGTQTDACAAMVAASAGNWTTDHKLLGLAYGYFKLIYVDGSWPSGVPTIKAVLKGKKVYDPRTAETVWSDNAALCINDYMRLPAESGGMGCTAAEVSSAAITTAANICDQLVASDTIGGTEKRYTINGIVGLDNTPAAIVKSMLTACAGSGIYNGAEWKIMMGAPSTYVATIDESWLNGGLSFNVGGGKNNSVNMVKGLYTDAAAYWEDTEFPVVTSDTYLAEDYNEELTANISLPFTTSVSTAQRLAKITLERSRLGFTMNYPCNMQAFQLDAMDVIRVNNALMGLENALFRIASWDFAAMGGVNLSLTQDDSSVYDWSADDLAEVAVIPDLVLPDPWAIGPPTNLEVSDAAVSYPGSITRSETTFTWDSPSALATSFIVQLDGVDYAVAVTNKYVFANLVPAEYTFGVIAVNAAGARSTTATTTHTVTTPSGTGTGATAAASANATASTVSVTSADAGATYNAAAQTLINELKSDLNTAVGDFNAAISSLNDLKAKLRTAGLLST